MTMVTCLHCAAVMVRALSGFLKVTCHCFVLLCMIHNMVIYRHCSCGLWSYVAAYKGNALFLGYWITFG